MMDQSLSAPDSIPAGTDRSVSSLEELLDRHPSCTLALFGDIGTGVTFVSAGPMQIRREALDALCTEASIAFGASDAPTLGATQSDYIINMTGRATSVFVRSPVERSEAVVCVCTPDVVVASLISDVKGFLQGESAA